MKKDNDDIICAEKVSRMLSQNTTSVLSSAALGLLLLYTQAQQANIPIHNIYFWIAILLLISVVRISIGRYYQYHPTTEVKQLAFRLNVLRACLIINASCWGANVYLVGNKQSIELLFFSSFIISGITSGAVVSTAIDKICATAYIVFAIIPLTIYLFILQTPVTLAMALAGVLYLVFMYFSINNLHKHLIDNIFLRIEAEKRDVQIKEMAFHDALTGLPNRRLLFDRLAHAISLGKRNQTGGAVMFIDLDDFKKLNDTQGHAMGDSLLQQVASRLQGFVRESDTVTRFGGDEFVILFEKLPIEKQEAYQEVNKIMEKLLNDINRPFIINGLPYYVTPSIGVALFEGNGYTPDELLKHADVAMYQAKRAGRNNGKIYNPLV